MVHHRRELRRDQHRQRDALALDRLDGRQRLELFVQGDAGAGVERRQCQDIEPADVEQRQRGQHPVGTGQIVHVRAVERIPEQRALRQHDAFRHAGRARGVANQHRVIEAAGRKRRTLRFRRQGKIVPGDPAGGNVAQRGPDHAGTIAVQRLRAFGEGRVDQYRAWRTIGEHTGVFGRGVPPVQWHHNRAAPRTGKQQREHFRMVAPKIGHQVAMPHAKRGKPAAGAPNAFGKRGIIQVVLRRTGSRACPA